MTIGTQMALEINIALRMTIKSNRKIHTYAPQNRTSFMEVFWRIEKLSVILPPLNSSVIIRIVGLYDGFLFFISIRLFFFLQTIPAFF